MTARNPRRGTKGDDAPSPATAGPTAYGKILFAVIERRLKEPATRESYVSPEEIARALRANPGIPLPTAIRDYLCDLLEGKVRVPAGRPATWKNPLEEVKRSLIPYYYARHLAWLQRRSRSLGLEGWKQIRGADWWRGPPSERAARMTQRLLRLRIDWRRVRNIASEARGDG